MLRQIAGWPSALPTAICCPAGGGLAVDRDLGDHGAGQAGQLYRPDQAGGAGRSRTACWLVLLAAVDPAAMTVPPGATVAAGVEA